MGRIVNSAKVSLTEAALEGRIVSVIKAWAMRFPHELVALERKVKLLRANLDNEKATSDHMLHKAEIPVTLHRALCLCISPDWLDDVKVRNMFYRNFTVGLVNRTSVSKR